VGTFAIALIVFVCAFGSALLGVHLRKRLPDHHLQQDSVDVVKLTMGLIATMVALILGLLIASAKGNFDTLNGEVQRSAVNVIKLDRTLARYGSETDELRARLRQFMARRIEATWPEDGSPPRKLDTPDVTRDAEALEDGIWRLAPQTEIQREFQSQALQLTREMLGARWHVFAQSSSQLPMAFLVILVFWLSILFASFGVFAPRNATVIVAFVLCAVAVSSSIFLILEMNHPLGGMIQISSAPMRYALSQLGQ
jgi:hypothetical protein